MAESCTIAIWLIVVVVERHFDVLLLVPEPEEEGNGEDKRGESVEER